MFIQPDWFEVTKAGVGTNRYAYSFSDPVNNLDPNGNFGFLGAAIGGFLSQVQLLAGLPGNYPAGNLLLVQREGWPEKERY